MAQQLRHEIQRCEVVRMSAQGRHHMALLEVKSWENLHGVIPHKRLGLFEAYLGAVAIYPTILTLGKGVVNPIRMLIRWWRGPSAPQSPLPRVFQPV